MSLTMGTISLVYASHLFCLCSVRHHRLLSSFLFRSTSRRGAMTCSRPTSVRADHSVLLPTLTVSSLACWHVIGIRNVQRLFHALLKSYSIFESIQRPCVWGTLRQVIGCGCWPWTHCQATLSPGPSCSLAILIVTQSDSLVVSVDLLSSQRWIACSVTSDSIF